MAKQNSTAIIKTTTKWITTRATNNRTPLSSSSSSTTFNQSLPLYEIRTTLESSTFILVILPLLPYRMWHTCEYVYAPVSVYECVVICVHFPRFYGKPRCTQIYVHAHTRCSNGSIFVFRFFSILPLLSPSHRICLYLILVSISLALSCTLLLSSSHHHQCTFSQIPCHTFVSFVYTHSQVYVVRSLTAHIIISYYILYFQSCVHLPLYLFVLFCFSFCLNYYFRVLSLLLMLKCTVDWLTISTITMQ